MSAETEDARLHAFSSGRVTGVFYRMFVLKQAQALGLGGYVRNLSDTRVEVVAEGPKTRLEMLAERLKQGPAGAVVEHVELDWGRSLREFDGFRIEYT